MAASTCNGPLPVMRVLDMINGGIVAPDWSCLDKPVAPPTAGKQLLQFNFKPFAVGSLDGVTVDFYLGSSTLGPPHASRTFSGGVDMVSVEVPVGQAAITVKTHALEGGINSLAELREYELPILKPEEPVSGFTMLTALRRLIASEVLENPGVVDDDPTKALLGAYARDCSGHSVGGAQFELLDSTGAVVQSGPETGSPHSAYTLFAFPDPECTYTSLDQAAWIMLNAPVNASEAGVTTPYRLRVKGRLTASDIEPVVFGEVGLELFAGIISFIHLPLQRH